MSYFLSFWRQRPECKLPPKEIDNLLLEGKPVSGLVPLDSGAIAKRFSELFPGIRHSRRKDSDELIQSDWESADGSRSFLIDWSPLYFSIQRSTATDDDLNLAIEIAIEFGCRLFDPQIGVRYEG